MQARVLPGSTRFGGILFVAPVGNLAPVCSGSFTCRMDLALLVLRPHLSWLARRKLATLKTENPIPWRTPPLLGHAETILSNLLVDTGVDHSLDSFSSDHALLSSCCYTAYIQKPVINMWSCGLMDKALVFGTKDCRLDSCQDQPVLVVSCFLLPRAMSRLFAHVRSHARWT